MQFVVHDMTGYFNPKEKVLKLTNSRRILIFYAGLNFNSGISHFLEKIRLLYDYILTASFEDCTFLDYLNQFRISDK